MSQLAVYGIAIAFGFVAWGLVTAHYIWPVIRGRSSADALRPLLLLHCFRFIGLAFVVPGVVSPDLPAAFASPAAYGDLMAAVFALLALAVGQPGVQLLGNWRPPLRLLSRQSCRAGTGTTCATYFIVIVLVPLLLITHGLVFRLLLRGNVIEAEPGGTR